VSWVEKAKKRAALDAAQLVEDGFIIGLGSGSTVAYVIEEIGKRVQTENLRVLGVPTSHQASLLAIENKIPLTTLDEHPEIDLALDGADQIDKELNLIKGMGGALTREKIVASASKKFVIVADETKLVDKLGKNQPVPVEVLPFATPTVMSKIREMGGKPVLREAKCKVGPVITDNGNFIIDAEFAKIPEPKELNTRLKLIPGVIETGLFIEMADMVYLGTPTSVQKLKRESSRPLKAE
jgi:ribose 5-phosphate isomerase A